MSSIQGTVSISNFRFSIAQTAYGHGQSGKVLDQAERVDFRGNLINRTPVSLRHQDTAATASEQAAGPQNLRGRRVEAGSKWTQERLAGILAAAVAAESFKIPR